MKGLLTWAIALIFAGCGSGPSLWIGGARVTSAQLCAGDVNCRIPGELQPFNAEDAISFREPANWLGHAMWEAKDEYGLPSLCGEDMTAEEIAGSVDGVPYTADVEATTKTVRDITLSLEAQFEKGALGSAAKLALEQSVQNALGAKVQVQVQPYALDRRLLQKRREQCKAAHPSGGNLIIAAAVARVAGTTAQRLQDELEMAASASTELHAALTAKATATLKDAVTLSVKQAVAPYDRVMMLGVVDF